MFMRVLAGVAIVTLSVSSSIAAPPSPPPPSSNPMSPVSSVLGAITGTPQGWTGNLDGSFRQAQSGVLCPVQFKSFHLDNVTGTSTDNPNVLGACRYSDGVGRTGSIRIRKYLEGWGSDQTLADNDKALMATDGSAPPMLMRSTIDHKSGGGRLTVTAVRNGFLVDCSVVQLGQDRPSGDFPLYCTTIPSQ